MFARGFVFVSEKKNVEIGFFSIQMLTLVPSLSERCFEIMIVLKLNPLQGGQVLISLAK